MKKKDIKVGDTLTGHWVSRMGVPYEAPVTVQHIGAHKIQVTIRDGLKKYWIGAENLTEGNNA